MAVITDAILSIASLLVAGPLNLWAALVWVCNSCQPQDDQCIDEMEILGRPAEFPLHVCGGQIGKEEYHSLVPPCMIYDQVIDAYLRVLQERYPVVAFPSFTALFWQYDDFSCLHLEVDLSSAEWLFVPINENGIHWKLLCAHIPSAVVFVLDSLPGHNGIYIDQFRTYITRRREISVDVPAQWLADNVRCTQQTDNHSCGAFVMLNALALARREGVPSVTQTRALEMRKVVRRELLQASGRR